MASLSAPPGRTPIAADQPAGLSWLTWFQQIYDFCKAYIAVNPLQSYTVATVPAAASCTGSLIYVSNESGGAVPAFSDGANWRRVTDRAVIS